MILYLSLILAVPLGIFLSALTRDEKKIYSKAPYFPVLLWVLAIISAIFYTTNEELALVTTFMFITILTWQRI